MCFCIIIFNSIISDPQIAVKFMAKQHKYERLKDFRLGSVFRQLFGQAAGTASGDAHKRIRSTFDGCYSAESVSRTVDMMEEECQKFLRLMVEQKKVIVTQPQSRVFVPYCAGLTKRVTLESSVTGLTLIGFKKQYK